ncbi:restriction endonuclease subunit S [Fructobacillus fructosus]|uniref:restriction endonuclease subunit S n=1 Tax=Fructobacillus fructosus TaxID=1631 RepID=UPI003BAC6A6A
MEQGGIGWASTDVDEAIVTENMPTLSLNKNVFSKYFLNSLFQTETFYKKCILDNITGGSAQIAIHEDNLLKSVLPLPPIDEQEKVGSLLQDVENVITLHR